MAFYFEGDAFRRRQIELERKAGLISDYRFSFFTGYQSFDDCKRNVKALFIKPLIDGFLLLNTVTELLRDALFFVIDLAFVDGQAMINHGKDMISHFPQILYTVNSLVFETSCLLFQLLSHSLASLVSLTTCCGGQDETHESSEQLVLT